MTGQLQSDEESRRLAAVRLVGQLLSIEGSQLEQEAPHLAAGFLGRLLDNKVGWCHWAQAKRNALRSEIYGLHQEQPGGPVGQLLRGKWGAAETGDAVPGCVISRWLLDNQLVPQPCRKLQCSGPWASMEAAGSTQSMSNVCSISTMCWCANPTNMSQNYIKMAGWGGC